MEARNGGKTLNPEQTQPRPEGMDAYEPPVVTSLGSVDELTLGGSTGPLEQGGGRTFLYP